MCYAHSDDCRRLPSEEAESAVLERDSLWVRLEGRTQFLIDRKVYFIDCKVRKEMRDTTPVSVFLKK